MGLTATPVNSETYSQQLHQDIKQLKHRLILTSPEMCLEHKEFSFLVHDATFSQNIMAFVIDEAHCISEWGPNFHKKYDELAKLRSFVPLSIPFLATSATLPPHVLADVRLKLCMSDTRTFLVNLGNDRPNITPLVFRTHAAASDLSALNFTAREAFESKQLIPTVIFFNKRDLTQHGCHHLQRNTFGNFFAAFSL
ncbi:hypothetical protein WOLCODRAFT_85959 [Wolfiporia cocos MD-104 SS10]|uniref:Helicase ATP-binding domain-containing protein n=1 Tax=Wolfiporia cocos (strain MD-104) TaxID=742152 RepID=A0A2H3JU06_WOLCO|nr:hypothetical protein WOLCODRAFT_85959 [Wolfiporia cocos MD-104 SS10]